MLFMYVLFQPFSYTFQNFLFEKIKLKIDHVTFLGFSFVFVQYGRALIPLFSSCIVSQEKTLGFFWFFGLFFFDLAEFLDFF